MNKEELRNSIERMLKVKYGKTLDKALEYEVFNALSLSLLENIVDDWNATTELYSKGKQAYYFSAEYLMGRALGNNLISIGGYSEVRELLKKLNIDINKIEEIEEDAGLGNGGLGRLAACFMDSAAAMEIPLIGYGLRYNNGLFNQYIEDGFQIEDGDYWLKYGDPWSIRKESETQIIHFEDMDVKAVPYDMPIIGYGTRNINTLRLWKAEPLKDFDFKLFNDQKYDKAIELKNRAEDITRVLYPNDSSEEGKILRLRQQYLLVSASLKDIIKKHKEMFGTVTKKLGELNAIQLNDTHPTLGIPELIRILVDEEGLTFEDSLDIAKSMFSYTNHTILAEALEKWDIDLIEELFPRILEVIKDIDKRFVAELKDKGYDGADIKNYKIIYKKQVRMANLAIHVGSVVNGVAKLHTDILKETELRNWYELYPEKFQNKTNGITPRRWLRLSNPELSALITELLGSEKWVRNLSLLKNLEKYVDDKEILNRFMSIKHKKKEQLAEYIKENEGVDIDPDSLFDIQIKRLHEYKRQLLNAIYILDLYYRVKENPNMDIPKITFLFGAKAFPGYKRAKAIVKFINEIANLVNNDKEINGKIKVVFVQNYRVSYAEKLCPAADISKQISTAGKEASGTGNMKLMLNGAPTFGTLDGANVEIVNESGEENNFIFGLKVQDIENLKEDYNPKDYYEKNLSLKKVLDTLVDGTFNDGGTGDFEDLFDSLLEEGDQYYILADFESFKETEDKVFEAYKNKEKWAKKCFLNTCNAGIFSSDRTILEYAKDIWNIERKSL
ncbi:glycogen/starch/alpha-glucan phosphorylase [Clostridium sp. SHJSY1]|uniref:glycogen/starch/alpha-glucan phosphorylase n=1 Tax=Clostridium sp. SHJSY1 TaxID=2942483 RepID=UPI00287592A7|nr:glycogen/starch/alpha-glucan phosphorylase [Clostridium sp. SHJSY1]MDS0526948.1 glycogen/starch/alpha-glucan phosphorylase [Clostridium sp. SHJSY1]